MESKASSGSPDAPMSLLSSHGPGSCASTPSAAMDTSGRRDRLLGDLASQSWRTATIILDRAGGGARQGPGVRGHLPEVGEAGRCWGWFSDELFP